MGGQHSHQPEPEWNGTEWSQREFQEAEERRRQAEEAARRAREAAERAAREAEEQQRRECDARLAAERAAQAAHEAAERIRQQKEKAERAKQRDREETEARAREARRQWAKEEETRRSRRAKEEAEREAQEAAEREELQRLLKKAVVIPTSEEIRLAKAKVQYNDAMFHFAVVGIAGSGKSSLINALCGMNDNHPNAAPTAVNKSTMKISRYVDTTHPEQFAWYDVPGSSTLGTPVWRYFNSQGLYVFDCVLILFNDRLTVMDQAILTNCHYFQIPTFIVRSKSDQHIRNLVMDMGHDPDKEAGSREQFHEVARKKLIKETRRTVRESLVEANLDSQRVYIVSKKTLFGAVKNKEPDPGMIDEAELLTDLSGAWVSKRYKRPLY